MNRPGITVVDLFNPSNYQEDNGKVYIKLTEPTDPSRPTSGDEDIILTKQEYFLAGWYETRDLVDKDGNKLEEDKDGNFFIKGTETKSNPVDKDGNALEYDANGTLVIKGTNTKSEPAYAYSDYWDFAEDTIEYEVGSGKIEKTLYAGWVPYYEFQYFYKVEGSTDDWKFINKTSFDYKTTNAENSVTHDKDTIWIPEWENGIMDHKHEYEDKSDYSFPKVEGTTFLKAYTSPECNVENEITESFIHPGSLDVETGKAVGRIQKIYVLVEDVERYKISTAKQLSDNGNAAGVYEIYADLDFSSEDASWPLELSTGEFTGQMYSATGETFKIQNVTVTHNSDVDLYGGIFGKITKTAKIQNLAFENATFTLENGGYRLEDAKYGLFAGEIEQGATLSVSVSGEMRLGYIQSLGADYSVNVLANGVTTGITKQTVKLSVGGQYLYDDAEGNPLYLYSIDPETVTVDTDGTISFTIGFTDLDAAYKTQEFTNIEY